MGGLLYRIVDTAIVLVCLPIYALAYPVIKIREYYEKKKPLVIGKEVAHFIARDLREDYKVVDLSRLAEGLVGINKRRYGTLRFTSLPPYEQQVHYIPVAEFWVPRPMNYRS